MKCANTVHMETYMCTQTYLPGRMNESFFLLAAGKSPWTDTKNTMKLYKESQSSQKQGCFVPPCLSLVKPGLRVISDDVI